MSSSGRRGGGRGSRAGMGSRAGLGSSSGRPITGRPMTGRPMTASVRPGTSAGATNGPETTRIAEDEEMYDDEYDDEDYESEDGDVFAFVPPDLGPAPEVVQTASAEPSVQQQQPEQAPLTEEEETFYYDETTGAVYDAQGRLVEMPPGFDASAVHQQQQMAAAPVQNLSVNPTSEILPGPQTPQEPAPTAVLGKSSIEETMLDSATPAYRGRSFEDPATPNGTLHRISLDRKDSNTSSVFRDGMNAPMLSHARSISGFRSMEVLPEVEHNSSRKVTPVRPTSRDVGLTVNGAPQLDQARRGSAHSGIELLPSHHPNVMRQRTNRSSQYADAGPSPTREMKFNLDSPSYDDLDEFDAKYHTNMQMGQGPGLAHPNISFQTPDASGKALRMVELEMETEEDSPYPEVRASVSNIDDPDLPVSTFRAWFLAFLLSTLAGAINMVLSLRYPAPTLTPLVVQLVAYPCGKLMAAVLPIRTWTLPRWLGGGSFSFNPGMFNIKEHTLISIVLNISIAQAYALNSTIILNSPRFYNTPKPTIFTVLYVVSTQMIGFSMAGICRRFLVWPASMIWPQNLVTATILNTLHAEEDGADGSMTRFRYFTLLLGGAFVWYFVPGFLFQALSSFAWLCWILPNNFVINTLFGTSSGLGLTTITFDWSQVSFIGSPLVYPWWSECNIFFGFILFECIVGLSLYFTNTLNSAYLPFNGSSSYDRFGNPYNISRIITSTNELDIQTYNNYSTLFLPMTYTIVYMTGFATSTAVLTHTLLYHGKSLWRGIRNFRTEEDDIHAKFMKRYREVPEWWYAAVGLTTFALSIISIEVWETGLPVWGLLLSLAIPAVYALPSGFIYAMTGSLVGTNLIGELVAGYAMPGNPTANQIFKVYSLQTLSSTLSFTQDLKLGHYMKVPPRVSFFAQIIFALWIAVVQIGVQQFMVVQVPDLCSPDQQHHFTCPHARVFFTASVVWGMIGPQRLFGTGGLYSPLYWALLIGALLPIPVWFMARKYPMTWIKFISVPIILNAVIYIPPGSGLVYTSWFAVAIVFQYLIRKYNFRWWSKYNFVTSAALDSGTIFSTLVIFLVLQLPRDGTISLNWWGNAVVGNNLDAASVAWKTAPPDGFAPPPSAM